MLVCSICRNISTRYVHVGLLKVLQKLKFYFRVIPFTHFAVISALILIFEFDLSKVNPFHIGPTELRTRVPCITSKRTCQLTQSPLIIIWHR